MYSWGVAYALDKKLHVHCRIQIEDVALLQLHKASEDKMATTVHALAMKSLAP